MKRIEGNAAGQISIQKVTEREGKKLKTSERACEAVRDRVDGSSARLGDQSSDGDKERDRAKMIARTQRSPG